MTLQVSVAISYKDIFDDYETVDMLELIKDIPTNNALEIISYFLSQIHTNEQDTSKQLELLKMWVCRFPQAERQRINDFIKKINNNVNADFNFINNASGLILIEELIDNANELEILPNLTPAQELNLLKAYLFCSQIWIDKQLGDSEMPRIKSAEDVIYILLPAQLPYAEILEFKDFRLQFIKATYFFKFCEENLEFQKYLKIFLNEYKLDSWKMYLSNTMDAYTNIFMSKGKHLPHKINVGNEHQQMRSFLENLSIDTKTFKKSDDFLSLRKKPFFKINENIFLILNINFLIDKMYQGLQFDFAEILVKCQETFKGKLIKNTADFLNIWSSTFAEIGLFYKVMDYTFEESGYIKFSGEEIKDKITGEPDYYMRDKNKIFIFEFKNIFLGSEVKQSNDYNQIEIGISKKLVKNQNGKPKGLTQLVNVIEKIRNGEFEKIDDYNFENTIVYPIIVYVDFSFNLSGINHLLNEEFKKHIKKENIKNSHNVRGVTLIDLDSFIKFQDLYRSQQLELNICLDEYYKYINCTGDLLRNNATFNTFIHEKTSKLKYDSPKMFMEELNKMLNPHEQK